MPNTTTKKFDLDVLRGAKFVTSYQFTGNIVSAKAKALEVAALHLGAVVAVLDSGRNVFTAPGGK